jgi:hypothetical protein
MDFFDSLYETNSDRTTFESITMWEALRIPYNILLALSMFILFGIVNFTVRDSLDAMLPFAFLLLCNFFYTFSWVTELLLPAKPFTAKKSFSMVWLFRFFGFFYSLYSILYCGQGVASSQWKMTNCSEKHGIVRLFQRKKAHFML